MANYADLKSSIQAVIATNGNNEITGALLQQSLLAMIDSLGAGYQYMGPATLSTNPGTPDQNVFYFAQEVGIYANFGSLTFVEGEFGFLRYNGTWQKESLSLPTFAQVEGNELAIQLLDMRVSGNGGTFPYIVTLGKIYNANGMRDSDSYCVSQKLPAGTYNLPQISPDYRFVCYKYVSDSSGTVIGSTSFNGAARTVTSDTDFIITFRKAVVGRMSQDDVNTLEGYSFTKVPEALSLEEMRTAIANCQDDIITLRMLLTGVFINSNFSELNSGVISYKESLRGVANFKVKITKNAGNQNVFSVRITTEDGSGTRTLRLNCAFGTEYEFTGVDVATYPILHIYQATNGTAVSPTSYDLVVTNLESIESDVSGLAAQVQTLQNDIDDKVLGEYVNEDVSELSNGSLSFWSTINKSRFSIVVTKNAGNLNVFSIRLRPVSGSDVVLQSGCQFGQVYTFDVDGDTYPTVGIYQQGAGTTIQPTSYNVHIFSPDAMGTEVQELSENVAKINDLNENSIWGVYIDEEFSENTAGVLSIQRYLGKTSFKVLVEKIAGNESVYSIRARTAANAEIILKANCEFGKEYYFENVSEEYSYILIYQGSAGTTISPTSYRLVVSNSGNTLHNQVEQAIRTTGLSGKKILMLGDSITQLPRTGATVSGDGIVEYFAQKTGATVFRGAFGGAHIASRIDVSGITTISSTTEAVAFLDIVNLVRAITTNDFSMQDAAVAYSGVDAYYATVLATIKSIDFSTLDAITIFAGTNDYNTTSTVIGEADSFEEVLNLRGALNSIIRMISTTFPKIKLYIFTPIVRWWPTDDTMDWTNVAMWCENYARGGRYLRDFVEAIQATAEKWQIPVCDMYHSMGWNVYNYEQFCTANDGTHPRNGFKQLADREAAFIMSVQ